MRRLPKRRASVGLLVLVLLVAGAVLLPSAQATHVNDRTTLPRPSQVVPETGVPIVDQVSDAAADAGDEVVTTVNEETADAGSEPQTPATYFHDGFDGDHLGGWKPTDWRTFQVHESVNDAAGWRVDPKAAYQGPNGSWFGDEDGYPISTDTTVHTYMVSPRISLDSLPVNGTQGRRDLRAPQTIETPLGPVGVTRNGCVLPLATFCSPALVDGQTVADRIQLTLGHRYHFGCENEFDRSGAGGGTSDQDCRWSNPDAEALKGIDGGRVEVFLDDPPTPGESPDAILSPRESQGYRCTESFGGNCPNDNDLGHVAYTGVRQAFVEHTFDLTRFAGRDVWLAFHVASQTPPAYSPDDYFTTTTSPESDDAVSFDYFAPDLAFYGWQIDEIRLEGPAYPHNLAVDEVLQPHLQTDGDANRRTVAPGPDQVPFSMVVANRGQFTENATATLTLDPSIDCKPQPVDGLRPGETRRVTFPCTHDGTSKDIQNGKNYAAAFRINRTVPADAARLDGSPDDNQVRFEITVERDPNIRFLVPPTVEPKTSVPSTPRTVAVPIFNAGNGNETVQADLTVWYDPPGEPEAFAVDETSNATADPSRTVQLPSKEAQELRWSDVVLSRPGEYRLEVQADIDLPPGFGPFEAIEETATAGTLTSSGVAYRHDFTESGLSVPDSLARPDHPSWGRWNSTVDADVAPPRLPADDRGTGPRSVWELNPGRPVSHDAEARRVGVLVGNVTTERLREIAANKPDTVFSKFRVETTQYLDMPCGVHPRGSTSTPSDCPAYAGRYFSGRSRFTPWLHPPNVRLSLDNLPPETRQTTSSNVNVGVPFHGLVCLVSNQVCQNVPTGVGTGSALNRTRNADASLQTLPYRLGTVPETNAANRLAYHSNQWLNASRHITAEQLLGRTHSAFSRDAVPSRVPLAAADGLSLRFEAEGCTAQRLHPLFGEGYATAGSSEFPAMRGCPLWRIARAAVWGVPAGGSNPIPLIRWNGYENGTVGNWDSWTRGSLPRGAAGPDPRMDLACATGHGNLPSCPQIWRRRAIDSFSPTEPEDHSMPELFSTENWTRYEGDETGVPLDESGFWTTNPDLTTSTKTYPNRQRATLRSPVFRAPAAGDAPTLRFDHKFEFINASIASGAHLADHGWVMVRFFGQDAATGDLRPATPFLPVDVDSPGRSAFEGSDCNRRDDCLPFDERSTLQVSLPLDDLPVLDYRGIRPTLDGSLSYTDPGARDLVDLQRDCGGPCLFQVAFRAETSDFEQSVHKDNSKGDGEGWVVDAFEILRQKRLAHDLDVSGAHLEADYNWKTLDFGPGTEATVVLNVTNTGLFRQPPAPGIDVVVETTWTPVDGGDPKSQTWTAPPDVVLPPEGQGSLRVPVTIPRQPSEYQVKLNVSLKGTVGGVAIRDQAPSNNCAFLEGDQVRAKKGCGASASPVLVKARPRFSVDVDVRPRVGVSTVDRELFLDVQNTGNTLFDTAELTRCIIPVGSTGGGTCGSLGTADRSPAPGNTSTLPDLFEDSSDLRSDAKLFRLDEAGSFILLVKLDGTGFASQDRIFIESFDPFYVDTFDTTLQRKRSMVSDRLKPTNEGEGPWSLESVGDRSKAWHLGDAERRTYPDDADATLQLSDVDLTQASLARLALTHRYDLEKGFDGARLEARRGDGPWAPLQPRGGYTGTLHGANPMVPGNDPTLVVPAWTGDSNGWTVDEFDLAQIPGFTTPSLLTAFDQDHIESQDVEHIKPSEGERRGPPDADPTAPRFRESVTLGRSWSRKGDCILDSTRNPLLEDCWYRENLNYRDPLPDPAPDGIEDGIYWWSGSMNQSTTSFTRRTSLPLNVTLPPHEPGKRVQLSYWLWKEPSGGLRSPRFFWGETDGWVRHRLDLTGDQREDATRQIEMFEFENGGGGANFNRGTFVDDVRLQVVGQDGEVQKRTNYTTDRLCSKGNGENCWNEEGIDTDDRTPSEFGWRKAQAGEVIDPGTDWNVRTIQGPSDDPTKVWLYGSERTSQGGTYWEYVNNSESRLVTPMIDLTGVGGGTARLNFSDQYRMAGGDLRRVLVQPWQRDIDGGQVVRKPEPWQATDAVNPQSTSIQECGNLWCEHTVDLSSYIGQKIRIAFEIRTNSDNDNPGCASLAGDKIPGCYWAVTGVEVHGETLTGDKIDLRLRAATDGSTRSGEWAVRNLQITGRTFDKRQGNVAVLLDGPTHRPTAPGQTMEINGTVRNLANKQYLDGKLLLVANVTAEALTGDPEIPEPVFDAEGVQTFDTPVGPGRQVFLLSPGSGGDRSTFHLELPLPEGATGVEYTVDLELWERRSGAVRKFTDANLGDHRRSIRVSVTGDKAIVRADDTLTPRVVASGGSVQAEVDLRSTGTLPHETQVAFEAVDPLTDTVVASSPPIQTDEIAPGNQKTVSWTWQTKATDPGFYLIKATVGQTEEAIGLVLAGDKPIYMHADFEHPDLGATGWSSTDDCSFDTDCWYLLEGTAYNGSRSVHVGVTDEEFAQGERYNPGQSTRLVSSPIDFMEALEPLMTIPKLQDSPFNPLLSFRYRPLLSDVVTVEARTPGGGCAALEGSDVKLKGASNRWEPAQVALGPSQQGNSPVGKQTRLCFRFDSAFEEEERDKGLSIDALSVSPFDAAVQPSSREVALSPGADKRIFFKITNEGPVQDTYRVQIDPRSELTVFDAEVLTPSLTLDPGESGLAQIGVTSPSSGSVGAVGDIRLRAQSTGDPFREMFTRLRLRFEPDVLPDPAVELERASGAGQTVPEERPVSFLPTVRNLGDAEMRPADLVVEACPKEGGPCIELANRTLPRLPPLEDAPKKGKWSKTVSWSPENGTADDYDIVARVDPRGLLHQADRSNDVARLPLTVVPTERPDLRAVSLRVVKGNQPVHRAFDGDLLRIEGVVENAGNVEAKNAQVRLVNRFPLQERTVKALGPGERVVLSTQWRATPGNWIVTLEAVPGLGKVASRDPAHNNQQRWDLTIGEGSVNLTTAPQTLTLTEGTSDRVFVRAHSQRGEKIPLWWRAESDGGLSVTGLPARTNLSKGAIQEIPINVSASPFADAGRHVLTVDTFLNPDAAPAATAAVDVVVRQADPVSFDAERLTTAPGTATLSIDAVHRGAAPTRRDLTAMGPETWDLNVRENPLRMQPGETRTVRIALDIPASTPPGVYNVTIQASDGPPITVPVEVTGTARWRSEVVNVQLDNATRQVWIAVENTGNAPGVPPLTLPGTDAALDVDPPLAALNPGQRQTYRVQTDQMKKTSGLVLPGRTTPLSMEDLPETGTVTIDEWRVSPGRDLSAGQTVTISVRVNQTGEVPLADIPVRIFVAGALADEERISLPAEQPETTTLTWRATPGDHVVTVTAGLGADATARAARLTVDGLAPGSTTPGPSTLLVVVALSAATVWTGRRRWFREE